MAYPAREVLRTEIAMLDDMLRSIDPGRVIERGPVEARRAELQAELEQLAPDSPLLRLTFGGDPVEGNRSILANFGGRAAELFSQAVAAIDAGFEAPLGTVGPVPRSKERQLRIVGTAVGSFGFLMEPPAPAQLSLPEDDSHVDPSTAAVILLREAHEGNEEAMAKLLSAIPRPMSSLRKFVKYVTDNRAVFNVQLGAHRAGIHDVEEGRAMLELLRDDQLVREEQDLNVVLAGVLPETHRFEAKSDTETIEGAIASAVPVDELKQHLDARVRIRVRVTRFRQNTPRYVLLGFDPLGVP